MWKSGSNNNNNGRINTKFNIQENRKLGKMEKKVENTISKLYVRKKQKQNKSTDLGFKISYNTLYIPNVGMLSVEIKPSQEPQGKLRINQKVHITIIIVI